MLIASTTDRKMAADASLLVREPISAERLRILLVKPEASAGTVGLLSLARVPPLDLLMVAGTAADHDVRIIDLRLEPEDALEKASSGAGVRKDS